MKVSAKIKGDLAARAFFSSVRWETSLGEASTVQENPKMVRTEAEKMRVLSQNDLKPSRKQEKIIENWKLR